MENLNMDYKNIPGWGVDADPENEPTYPMKKYTGDDHERLNWQRPPQQIADVEILKSIERPNLSATFGTSNPPSGLSGMIRRLAFKFSESEYGHWLNLLLADRINVVEGVIDDLKHGYVPNFFEEEGWKAEWKYDRKTVVKKVATIAIITSAIVLLCTKNKKQKLGKKLFS